MFYIFIYIYIYKVRRFMQVNVAFFFTMERICLQFNTFSN